MPNKKSSSPPAERYVPRIAAAGAPRQVGSQQPPLQTLQRRLRALVVSNAFVTYYSPLIMEDWAKLFGLSLVPFGMVLYMVTIVVSDYILLTVQFSSEVLRGSPLKNLYGGIFKDTSPNLSWIILLSLQNAAEMQKCFILYLPCDETIKQRKE